jgi:phosphoribosyl 1,2-cyclic phosphodiesterase
MNVTLWGTRGSLAAPGPETAGYGGNTSCVEVRGPRGTVLVLDAGTGIRRLGAVLSSRPDAPLRRVDLLLTHLHMDHLQGLGFFGPLYNPAMEVHIWGPASTTQSLWDRLTRYLSPPLFPVHLRDIPCQLTLHEVPCDDFVIDEFRVSSALICHPGPTVGYRITTDDARLAYLPDHEPALGARAFPGREDWTSGYELARGVDLLIHDAQYSSHEYPSHIGWGHSSLQHALDFAALADVGQLVLFHHDPAHTDADIERLVGEAVAATQPPFPVIPGREGAMFALGRQAERPVAHKL